MSASQTTASKRDGLNPFQSGKAFFARTGGGENVGKQQVLFDRNTIALTGPDSVERVDAYGNVITQTHVITGGVYNERKDLPLTLNLDRFDLKSVDGVRHYNREALRI